MKKVIIIGAIILLVLIGVTTVIVLNKPKIINEDSFQAVSCVDSDGKDFSKRGITTASTPDAGEESGFETSTFEDSCNPSGYLIENYCGENTYVRATVKCKNGCVNGACI